MNVTFSGQPALYNASARFGQSTPKTAVRFGAEPTQMLDQPTRQNLTPMLRELNRGIRRIVPHGKQHIQFEAANVLEGDYEVYTLRIDGKPYTLSYFPGSGDKLKPSKQLFVLFNADQSTALRLEVSIKPRVFSTTDFHCQVSYGPGADPVVCNDVRDTRTYLPYRFFQNLVRHAQEQLKP